MVIEPEKSGNPKWPRGKRTEHVHRNDISVDNIQSICIYIYTHNIAEIYGFMRTHTVDILYI